MPPRDKRVLIDSSTFDDAGVFAHGRGEALVQTVDFFTPIVDDPYDFGAIAAANSLSDVYAMGGKPLTALALLCAPERALAPEVIAAVLQGGLDIMKKAGCAVVGGHSVRDPELKFGYAVTGIAKRKQLLRNSGARPGDRVYLTKPLGTGILSTALKQGQLDAPLTKRLTQHMMMLNRAASEAAVAAGARAATDVTGFGFLGHASQLADASGVTLRLRPAANWFLPRVLELLAAGVAPGGLARNREYYGERVDASGLAAAAPGSPAASLLDALFDPQTSGGLLVCVPARRAPAFEAGLRRRRVWHVAAGEAVRPARGAPAPAVELAAS
jgi:selenide,water dikinase